LHDVKLNTTVLAFAGALAIATTLALAAVSAVTIRSRQPIGASGNARSSVGRDARRMASILVVVELAMAVALLVGAGLIVRSLTKLSAVDPGFQVNGVLSFTTSIPAERYRTRAARHAFYVRADAALRSVPGVRDVGTAAIVPLTGNHWTAPFERADMRATGGQQPAEVGWQAASGGYFSALRIPVLSGRGFDDRDTPTSPPVAVVSQSPEHA